MAIRYKKCFTCGSFDVAKIIYGYPIADAFKEQEKGKIKLGGCVISEDSPTYHCNQCGKQWTADEAIDAAYDEIIGLRTSVGGFFGGYYEVTIDFQDRILVWKHSLENEPIEKQLSQSSLSQFISSLKMVDYCHKNVPKLPSFVPRFAMKCTSHCQPVYHQLTSV